MAFSWDKVINEEQRRVKRGSSIPVFTFKLCPASGRELLNGRLAGGGTGSADAAEAAEEEESEGFFNEAVALLTVREDKESVST